MTITIILFTYNRNEMLLNMLRHLRTFTQYKITICVLDDASELPQSEEALSLMDYYHRNEINEGKVGFWKQWQKAFMLCEELKADIYLFAPDDHQRYDIDRMVRIHERFKRKPYVVNSCFDGRTKSWNSREAIPVGKHLMRAFFCDCGFFCNRSVLQRLSFMMEPISPKWVVKNGRSSGVGRQLTRRFNGSSIPIYIPFKSLAFHGEHDSVMHYEGRKKYPLISR